MYKKNMNFTLLFQRAAEQGILLLGACVFAMIMANTALHGAYFSLTSGDILFVLGHKISLHEVTNDLLMVLFFFLVGIEIKREMINGKLSTMEKRILPVVAAIGGVLAPIAIYVALNHHDSIAVRGWAVPAATDIAFALGMFALLGKGLPVALRVFLAALAIVDDLIAVVLIALFYAGNLSALYLGLAAAICVVLYFTMRAKYSAVWFYTLAGTLLWYAVLRSGVHATIAGVLLGMLTPYYDKSGKFSLMNYFEEKLGGMMKFFILPLFAFVNSGVRIEGLGLETFTNTVTLGIILGLFVGKQVGICGFVYLKHRFMPSTDIQFTWPQFYSVSVLCGIGFTMSLFVGGLAFAEHPEYMDSMKIGVIFGSLLSSVVGGIIIYQIRKIKK